MPAAKSPVVPLYTLYFYLTEGCNLRCRHCWIDPPLQGEGKTYPVLDFDLFGSIVEQARPLGLTAVKLTGGEPLLHPRIHDILSHIRTNDLGLIMETNGTLCTPELASAIVACKKPFVSVSLDGADASTHEWVRGVKGSFESALTGIRNLVDAGLKPQIIMSLMRKNIHQIKDLVSLARSLGASSVKFNLVQPTARGEAMHQAGETLPLEELIATGEWVEKEFSKSAGLPLFYHHPPVFRPLSRIWGEGGLGCGRCGILGALGVLADGSYALCGIGETIPEMIFGHAQNDRLEDVWRTSPVLCELREGLPERITGICRDCLMKGACLGNCIAQNYYTSRDLWAPFWYCQEAWEKGLFPENRLVPRHTANTGLAHP